MQQSNRKATAAKPDVNPKAGDPEDEDDEDDKLLDDETPDDDEDEGEYTTPTEDDVRAAAKVDAMAPFIAPANHPHVRVEPPVPPPPPPVPNNAQPDPVATTAKTVRVKLVWPAERGAKMDCQGSSKIIWRYHGDIQDYPADQWHLLAKHPAVWQLAEPEDIHKANQAYVDNVETPEARLERINREHGLGVTGNESAGEADRQAAVRAKALAQATNTDAVVLRTRGSGASALGGGGPAAAGLGDGAGGEAVSLTGKPPSSPGHSIGRPATEHAPTLNLPERPSGALAPSTYDEAALAPHTETAALEEAAREEAVHAGKQQKTVHQPEPLDADRLADMSDADVHAEGNKRGYAMHPRLNPVNLRAKFLELQATAARK